MNDRLVEAPQDEPERVRKKRVAVYSKGYSQ
jgi:hypothetical protein